MMDDGLKLVLVTALLVGVAANAPPVPLNDVVVEKRFEPRECVRAAEAGDFVRYHYLGTLEGGRRFDSRYRSHSHSRSRSRLEPRRSHLCRDSGSGQIDQLAGVGEEMLGHKPCPNPGPVPPLWNWD